MLKILWIGLLMVNLASCTSKPDTIHCKLLTEAGTIIVELYPDKAPMTVFNFMRYVDDQLYDSCTFFRACTPENEVGRTIKIEVIQGGDLPEVKRYAPICIETTRETGLMHVDGAISMARDTPNSAQSDFFICINAQPELDFGGKRNPDGKGFAAFGRVIQGMEVVRKIQQMACNQQLLRNPVMIISIRRMED
ncbi:MAG: peptidylprolyl isomerase [Bacteroidetes bacterium GWE2_40_63]|nr:MAG: peptidylprolyl isomerase [Bacteroidetes bacterium GWA2_40_14]OFX58515.1 MAG: peptidylprolyl isomerase [Bacteroidetes bacterium GWC2_40_13]OFX74137.1 MAG: peptidylprolyl isomerase [Bacteroidetes bacterium GWD2_40_43]OFX93029.1 MAG: peptidylprolyl isomerase [Bacteroidetes bacterium GWE2_40_63]OFY21399.1 MAG: peptidylprolyl isomerase [Bacteroidetes bacterium GWF2_40_13]OFZ27393.1 MAG: peptidylprolyl isomerase [Bacteroidetes bacterium RIFOXYC2_FULL_40_12]